jgi:hypothetical protein
MSRDTTATTPPRDPSSSLHRETIMQFAHPIISLPLGDYLRLQRLMRTMIGSRTALASVLRRKLGSANPKLTSSMPRDRAVSGTRVRFRVDRREPQERLLTWQPPSAGDTGTLSLLSARGLALLGLGPGQSVTYRTQGDRTEFLELERLFHPVAPALQVAASRRADPSLRRRMPDTTPIPVAAPQSALAGE